MNISSAKYVDLEKSCIRAVIDGLTISVPVDPANRHFSAIMKAVEEGTLVIQEADPT